MPKQCKAYGNYTACNRQPPRSNELNLRQVSRVDCRQATRYKRKSWLYFSQEYISGYFLATNETLLELRRAKQVSQWEWSQLNKLGEQRNQFYNVVECEIDRFELGFDVFDASSVIKLGIKLCFLLRDWNIGCYCYVRIHSVEWSWPSWGTNG